MKGERSEDLIMVALFLIGLFSCLIIGFPIFLALIIPSAGFSNLRLKPPYYDDSPKGDQRDE